MKQYKAWELLPEEKVYLKSESDNVIAELKDKARHYPMMVALLESDRKEIAKLKRKIEFLKVTHGSCGECNKCADGMGKVFDENLNELKAQKAQAEDDCAYWKMNAGNAANAMHETEEYAMQLYNELRHHKYKRCLAMARWCDSEANYWYDSSKVQQCCRYGHYIRWFNKWSKLAEKFKEEK